MKKIFRPSLLRFPVETGTTRRPFTLPTRFNAASTGPHDRIDDGEHAPVRRKLQKRTAVNRLRQPICANHVRI